MEVATKQPKGHGQPRRNPNYANELITTYDPQVETLADLLEYPIY